MARVLNPLMSADAKGSVGGFTFGRVPGGMGVKRKPYPARRMRGLQPRNRALLGFMARAWGGLDNAERASWRAWAEDHPEPDGFGGTFIMSGINAFVKLNFQAVRMGGLGVEQDLPPVVPPAASLLTFESVVGTVAAGDVICNWTNNGTGSADDFVEVQVAGPFQSEGIVEVHNRFAMNQIVVGNLLTATVEGLDVGMWYWFRARYIDEFGQTTAFMTDQMTPFVGP